MFSSIRFRLSLSYLAVIVLAMGISAFILLSFLEDYFMDSTRDSLEAQARITAQALIPGVSGVAYDYSDPALSGEPTAAQVQVVTMNTSSGTGTVDQEELVNYRLEQQIEDYNPAYNAVQYYRKDDVYSLQSQNVYLNTNEGTPGSTDLSLFTDTSIELGAELETRIRILDAEGTVLIDSMQEEQGKDMATDSLIVQAMNGQIASRTEESGDDTMHLAFPAMVEGQLAGIVYLSQPLDDVAAVLSDLRNRMLISTVIALALSAIVALLLSRAISNPVRRLTLASRAVAQGHLDQQVPVRSKDEIGQLSQTFNEMTTRLQSAMQMQTDFVANVSHESRTPLTSIKGMLETLRDGAVDDPQIRDRFLETMEGETDRLIRLVNDLLLLSKADSNALNLHTESTDLSKLVREIIDQLSPEIETENLDFKLEISPDLPSVPADPDRIRQVIVNLLDNAIKYSHDGGAITVTMMAGQDGSVVTRIRDEGIGIPADDLPRIGERFYRTDKARSRANGGTGLGLAIARTLVEAHGGKLTVESIEGNGTTVSFTLPA